MSPRTFARSHTLGAAARRLTAALMSCALLTALALAGAGAASAHAALIASDPAENAVLTASPERVSATFNEPMQPQFAAMTVVGPDGALWSTGDPQVHDTVISVAVRPLAQAGTYTANYRATSADGHVVTGSWAFELAVANTTTAGPSLTATPTTGPATPVAAAGSGSAGGGVPMWPFWIGAIVAVGAAAWWAVRRRT